MRNSHSITQKDSINYNIIENIKKRAKTTQAHEKQVHQMGEKKKRKDCKVIEITLSQSSQPLTFRRCHLRSFLLQLRSLFPFLLEQEVTSQVQ